MSTDGPKGRTPDSARPRLRDSPSHLLPSTALFNPLRNESHTSLRRDGGTPVENQHLPRAQPASFSKPPKQEDFRADAVWAEMQRTLADVELSAMNSSHLFSNTHTKALEGLRTAQLGLAVSWAKSEAEGIDEEFGDQAVGQMKADSPSVKDGRRQTLEAETERDILLARRRREANDRYFRQVNRGVEDVVKRLDDVVGAMRQVEKESREIWDGESDSDLASATDESVKTRMRGATIESKDTMGTESERMESPAPKAQSS